MKTGFGIWSIGLEEGCECPHVSMHCLHPTPVKQNPRTYWCIPSELSGHLLGCDIAFLSQEKYDEYTLEERAKIGRYGAENGPGKSTRQVLDTKRLP